MPHPDEVFATDPLEDDWLGFSKEPKEPTDPLADLDADWRRKRSRITGEWWGFPRDGALRPPDPVPSFEERVQRCREMGLVICTCTGVDRGEDQPRLLVYDPHCEVHGKVGKVA